MRKPVVSLKVGDAVGNARRWLYVVLDHARVQPDGTVKVLVAHNDGEDQPGRVEERHYLHRDAQVHVRR